MNHKICYYASKKSAKRWLERSWNNAYNFVPFSSEITDFSGFSAVCLVEPFESKHSTEDSLKRGVFLSIFQVWKRYLAAINPEIKLFLLRYTDHKHPNVIPLLSLEANFDWELKITTAYPCNINWEDKIETVGECALTRLALFFKGHNKQGFIDVVAKVRQMLDLVTYQLSIRGDDYFASLWTEEISTYTTQESLRLLSYRWRSFLPYFRTTPFWSELELLKIDDFFSLLLLTCSGQLDTSNHQAVTQKLRDFNALDAFKKLDQIQVKLNYFNKKFITPEILGDVLLIDDDMSFHERMIVSFPDYRITSAYNLREAKELLTKFPDQFRFVILDLRYGDGPENEGLLLLPWVRELLPGLPVIVISTTTNTVIQRNAIELGASYFLSKSSFSIATWKSEFFKALLEGEKRPSQSRIYLKSKASTERPSILIIDDDSDWLNRVNRSFEAFDFTLATTSRQARDYVEEKNEYHLIMLDLLLNDLQEDISDAMELLSFFEQTIPHVPVVAVSRRSDKTLIDLTLGYPNTTDFLRKDHFNITIWNKRLNNYIALGQRNTSINDHNIPITETYGESHNPLS